MSVTADPALQAAAWDLGPLVEGRGPSGSEQLLLDARDHAADFAERHRGRVAELSREELYERAQAEDVPGRSKMSKDELVEALADK